MMGGNAAERLERSERSQPIAGDGVGAAALVRQAAALGVRLEARNGGRLWASAPALLPPELRDSLAANRDAVLAVLTAAPRNPPRALRPGALTSTPRLPPDWCEGVVKLATMPAPPGIAPHRWRMFGADATRLLRDHGAALHAAGWDTLDLFGLHALAPATNAAGMGLAWLLGEAGGVLDVGPDAVGMRCTPGGARLAFYRRQGTRAGTVAAWEL